MNLFTDLSSILKKLGELDLKWDISWNSSDDDLASTVRARHNIDNNSILEVAIYNSYGGSSVPRVIGHSGDMHVAGPLFGIGISVIKTGSEGCEQLYYKLYPQQAKEEYFHYGNFWSSKTTVRSRRIVGHPTVSEDPQEYYALKEYFDHVTESPIQVRKDARQAQIREREGILEKAKQLFSDL